VVDRPSVPRVTPLRADERDEEVTVLLAEATVAGTEAGNLFGTLVRNRGLFRRWRPFCGKLLSGKLPARERELAILRVGWLCQAEYEWGQHVLAGRQAGLADAEINRVKDGPQADGWSNLERAVLLAVGELHVDSCISDATWAQLAHSYNDAQLIEFVMLVGHYHLVSFALNSLGVERDVGIPGF
jgi:4-carboxymuconolactone decarboxylase